MTEHSSALTLPELTDLAQDSTFQLRIHLLHAQMHHTGTEGMFAIDKYSSGIVRCSQLHLPETPEENYGKDPTASVSHAPLFMPGAPPKYTAGHVHSHPNTKVLYEDYLRLPSPTDLYNYATYFYPANSGHIAGIVLGGMQGADLLLYRAREGHFDPEKAADPDIYRNCIYDDRRAAIAAAGIALTHILVSPNGHVMGLELLEQLYE